MNLVTNYQTYQDIDAAEHRPLNNLSDRLVYVLQWRNISKADLAKQLGIKHQVIQYLCNGKAKQSRFTFEIADALGVNPDWLATGQGWITNTENQQFVDEDRVPVYEMEDILKAAQKQKNFSNLAPTSSIKTDSIGCNKAIAFYLQDQAMYPSFSLNTLLIFDMVKNADEDDYVLAYLHDTEELVFRQLAYSDEAIILKPFNSKSYKSRELTSPDALIGVLKEARSFF